MPRVLLEAAAMAKPLIATDVPGCRHAVEDGVNGLLCTVRDAGSLAGAMARMVEMGASGRQRMGAAGRAMVARAYDERIVVDLYLAAIEEALGPAGRA
jgi:glycosyltransferase involved in cell wall biosynthesis